MSRREVMNDWNSMTADDDLSWLLMNDDRDEKGDDEYEDERKWEHTHCKLILKIAARKK